MRDLSEIRVDIDAVDKELLALFERRIGLSDEVADYKMANHKPVLDAVREKEKLKGITDHFTDPFMKQASEELFVQIMSISRKKQYRQMAREGLGEDFHFTTVEAFDFTNSRVVYQGVEGAYSEVAAKRFFGENVTVHHVKTWRDAFEALRQDTCDYAVLPIENSTAGTIAENHDLLSEYDYHIIGEQVIDIDHALLGLPNARLSDIRTVYSHPQALSQCDNYLRRLHPEYKAVEMENTAVSAKKVKEDNDPTQAAIAGEINGRLYGLSVMERSIQDVKGNRTRFIVVGKECVYRKDAGRVSISFELPHEKGSLYRVLSHIIFNGLNMTKIESRPIRDRQWEYRFFIDFDGNLQQDAVQNALRGLKEETSRLRVLGNY